MRRRMSKNVARKRTVEVSLPRAVRRKKDGHSPTALGKENEDADAHALAPRSAGFSALSDTAKVKATLRIFNLCHLRAVEEEAKRCKGHKNVTPRPDLKALAKMRNMNAYLYTEKRFGHIPGVSVGDHFFSRAELVCLGIHTHWLNGIDYVTAGKNQKVSLAVSIVMSGGYEDDVDDAEEIIYTGQGGNNLSGDRRQSKDQKLVLGNLALKNSVDEGNTVRVIRGHENKKKNTTKVYTYDGLYKVVDYWLQKGLSGFRVYKFKLRRCEGQPVLTTEQVRFCKGKLPVVPSDRGLVCKDISNGLEVLPVAATNIVDSPPCAPDGYRYITQSEIDDEILVPPPGPGCNCKGFCTDPLTCSCARLNGKAFPYVDSNGQRLAEALDVVYECGPNCGCGPSCINRATQHGLLYRLEVYKTKHKGWAVRSWDFIPAGAPVCEYFGRISKNDGQTGAKNDMYLFDLDCIQTMQGMDGRQRRRRLLDERATETVDVDIEDHSEFCIDGAECGAVSRFINHSCEPNLYVQCVLSSHHDMRLPRLVLFAANNIPPLQELSYDYGYALDSVVGPDGVVKQLPCYCGTPSCRKRLY